MHKLLVICGATATGKTGLAISLAKKFNGEIISADSRQVYKKMDILTGKDIDKSSKFKVPTCAGRQSSKFKIENKKLFIGYRLKEKIPIWLVDAVGIEYSFNVGEYSKIATRIIEEVSFREKLPIIVGGTGLYIKSLLSPLQMISIPPNKKLRDELHKLGRKELINYLRKINPRKWNLLNHSDRMNPRRLIRAIEISLYTKSSSPTDFNTKQYLSNKKDTLIIGLTLPKEILNRRIDERIIKRIKEGALRETRKISQEKLSDSLPSLSSTGYRQLKNYLDGKTSLPEAILQWQIAEHTYAKRQLTWFKKVQDIYWYDSENKSSSLKIENRVLKWYTKKN